MNIQARYPTTADEFLRWNEGREGKREFVRGRVVEMMINVTETHYRIASRLVAQLLPQFDDREFIVGSADFGVRTADGVRYPDVMVHKPRDGRSLATAEPLLLAEVLSASSITDDFGQKAADYLGIASLRHYIVLSQNEARIWLWSRGEDDAWLKPQTVAREDGPVDLDGLGVTLDLTRLYAGVVPQDKPN
jgi:Uma2 family endonuclease